MQSNGVRVLCKWLAYLEKNWEQSGTGIECPEIDCPKCHTF
jgi:hypothetical protein